MILSVESRLKNKFLRFNVEEVLINISLSTKIYYKHHLFKFK